MATAFALDHIVLRCTDQESTLAWYIAHAGLAPVNLEDWRAGNAPFPSLRVNDDTIIDYIAGRDPAAQLGSLDHICFVVTADELATLRTDPELTVLSEGPRSGARGIGQSVYVRDPDGLLVEFRCYPES
jgi:catechol 2,3-dioxygenase-like lactoylglutathione lyase family enzyme